MDKKKKTNVKKKCAPKIVDLNVEQRRQALLKQKHCDAVALHIVSKLIDCPVEEDVFLQSLKYLNQCHYEDVIEERAITKMCGYPICANKIPDLPAKKYHISSKSNKIYDITERKNYCSNFCYAASSHIKNQMMTSPLWYRDQEKVPDFKLLEETVKGTPGEEIDQGVIKVPHKNDPAFTSISQFTQDVLNDIPDNYVEDNDLPEDDINKPSTSAQASNITTNKQDEPEPSCSKAQTNTVVQDIIDTFIPKEENFFYSKMFAPSLADILTENSKYFENVDKKLNEDDKDLSKTSTSTESDEPKLKGILSNKNKEKTKKNVSFASSFKEPKLENKTSKVFKKPVVATRVENNKPKHSAETNETSNQKEINDNVNFNHRLFVKESEDSLISKQVVEHKSILVSTTNTAKAVDAEKESRKLNLKNSATYAKAKQASVIENSENTKEQTIDKHIEIVSEINTTIKEDSKKESCQIDLKNSAISETKQKPISENNKNTNGQTVEKQREIVPKINIAKTVDIEKRENTNNSTSKTDEIGNDLLSKPVIEHKSVPISKENLTKSVDDQKVKRKLNLKNSSTYARAKQLSMKQSNENNIHNIGNESEANSVKVNLEQEKNKCENLINKTKNENLITKPVVEHKPEIISENNKIETDEKKEKRKLNLKNSALYAKTKQISKNIDNNVEKNDLNKDKPISERKSILISDKKVAKKENLKIKFINDVVVPNKVQIETKQEIKFKGRQLSEEDGFKFKQHLEKCFKEWCTIDTMIFLYGEEQVQKFMSEKTFKQYLNSKKNTEEEKMKRQKYEAICRRLNLMELADKQFDDSVKDSEKKPLPRYEELKEMAETMDLRVRAFYSGCFEVYDMEDEESAAEEEEESEAIVRGVPAVLPLVENKDYSQLRKKILLTSLHRTIPQLCTIFGISQSSLMSDMKHLVDTFSLTANNIVFKTAEWPMVAILLVKLLSMQNKDYVPMLQTQTTNDYITSLIKSLCFNEDNLDNFTLKFVDMHYFIQEYLKKVDEFHSVI